MTCALAWRALKIPSPTGLARKIVLGVLLVLVAVFTLWMIWEYVGWQNDVREVFEVAPISPGVWPTVLGVTLGVCVLILVFARAFLWMVVAIGHMLGRHLPARLSVLLAVVATLFLGHLLMTGVLMMAFFFVAGGVFGVEDIQTTNGVSAPVSALRSGSPRSQVPWDSLGRKGRDFVALGPSVAQIDEVTGGGTLQPIRVYVGLRSAPTLDERADLVLAELKRTGAFQRDVLVIATTTGTGGLDAAAVDPLEYLHNGNTAVAGVQYSYLPSWISLLADQKAVRETSQVVFDKVHDYWVTLPRNERPKLYLYGLSLGSLGVEAVLNSIDVMNEPVDGAFMSGPPFVNEMHAKLVVNRDPGSPARMPVYSGGRTVRFTGEDNTLDDLAGPWGPTRVVYLQHASDPVVFFSQDLTFSKPEWLGHDKQGPDVSNEFVWVPLVTMWQVALDLPAAGSVPWGYAHLYSPRANLDSWIAVTHAQNWDAAKTEAVVRAMAPVIGQ